MLLKHKRITDPLVLIRLPAAAIPCEESSALDAKFADRVEWMRVRGICIDLNESECPRLAKKSPLPETVVALSSSPSIET